MFAALALCVLTAQTDRLATIDGKVLDAVSNQPLAGACFGPTGVRPSSVPGCSRIWETVADPGGYDPKGDTVAVLTGIDGTKVWCASTMKQIRTVEFRGR